ncbi:hypothetical protein [Candidatus Stoquefichus massiliensis]|uniref:hypothetical protein n=1 Tax=Candidatus Stoquefichus massiliensis TaxID=1470350 RepID=UPI0004AFE1E6|nr:hypothetical protein [Candidatus Stoquefichus massiliensis]
MLLVLSLTGSGSVKVTNDSNEKIINKGTINVNCNETDAIEVNQGSRPKLDCDDYI